MPFAGHPLSSVTAVVEFESRPDHKVAQRAGHEYVIRLCQCAHARADVHGDPANVFTADLALPGVQPGPHLDAERLHRVADRHRAADRSLRAVEHRKESVSCGADFAAAEASELRADDGVVRIKQGMLVTVADLRGPSCRVYDVGEEHRGENPVVGHLSLVAVRNSAIS